MCWQWRWSWIIDSWRFYFAGHGVYEQRKSERSLVCLNSDIDTLLTIYRWLVFRNIAESWDPLRFGRAAFSSRRCLQGFIISLFGLVLRMTTILGNAFSARSNAIYHTCWWAYSKFYMLVPSFFEDKTNLIRDLFGPDLKPENVLIGQLRSCYWNIFQKFWQIVFLLRFHVSCKSVW